MTSQSKPPAEPVGIELLLELLNASEGVIDRNAAPALFEDPVAASSPVEPASPPPPVQHTQSADVVSALPELADDNRLPADITGDEGPEEMADDAENRFAAHIVRGMSKSKIR